MKIVADEKIPFLKGVLEPYAEMRYLPGAAITATEVKDADLLFVRTRTRCDRALLEGSSVRLVVTATIGFDHIAVEELKTLGIPWRNAPGCNARSVQNYIASALSSLGQDLTGKTLGVIGVGHVGKLVAEAGRIFGMRVLLNDPPRAAAEGGREFTELPELLRESDIVTLHVPLVKEGPWPTVRMADERFFAAMKPGAWFFNSCRGEALDIRAFLAAKRSGKLGGALMDVWPGEPDIAPELLAGVEIATPHIAGYSKEGKANGTGVCVRSAAELLGIEALRRWHPAALPAPEFEEELTLDDSLPLWRQIAQAVLHVYDIRRDVQALRRDPDRFESLRGGYWNRREFSGCTVRTGSCAAAEALAGLGFSVINLKQEK